MQAVTIELTQGKSALIDAADYELVAHYKWHAARHRNTFYAITAVSIGGGKQKTVRMHRLIMGAVSGEEIDHRDGDGLNNRRSNLRLASDSDNAANRRTNRWLERGRKGVYIHNPSGKWRAVIGHKGKKVSLGLFAKESDAVNAYNLKARELHGSFALLNQEAQ